MEKTNITADYHTHTTYSHGTGTVLQNVEQAKKLGLQKIAITDHGHNHPLVGVNRKEFDTIRADINNVHELVGGIDILMGIEANIIGMDGGIDLTDEDMSHLDIVLAGFHLTATQEKSSDYFNLIWNGVSTYVFPPTKGQVARNTTAFVNTIRKNKIDILTHIGFRLDVDYGEIGRACAEYGTYVELSSRHKTPNEKSIGALIDSGAQFVINSDAHKVSNIGKFDFALDLVKQFGIDDGRIANSNGKDLVLRSKK